MTLLQRHALRLVVAAGGTVYGGFFAEQLVPRRWSAQGATRWGCGYAKRLVEMGMLRENKYVCVGGAEYTITQKGHEAVA